VSVFIQLAASIAVCQCIGVVILKGFLYHGNRPEQLD
jgi:hypothetical protein